MYAKTAIALTLLACTLPSQADGTAAALYKTATLTVDVSGPDVSKRGLRGQVLQYSIRLL